MRNSKAFTLIELLVVVAIIALLIAILLPTLSRAREQTKKAVCQAHMKQVGTAFFVYGGSNDSMVPDGVSVYFDFNQANGNSTLFDNAHQASWPEELIKDGSVAEKFQTRTGPTSYGDGWASGWGIFYCPSSLTGNPASNPGKPEGTFESLQSGYGMGYYAGSVWYYTDTVAKTTPPLPNAAETDGSGNIIQPNTMRTQYWLPAHIVAVEGDTAFAGAIGAGGANSTTRYGVYTLRHFKGANYLMGDGHVEWSQTYNSADWTTYPASNWSIIGSSKMPSDGSVWGHNPYGRVNSSR